MACRGVVMSVPDLNEPAFETLTVTRMLDQTREAIDAAAEDRVALIGVEPRRVRRAARGGTTGAWSASC